MKVATVLLSPGALEEYLQPVYFPGQSLVCRLYCRGINDTYRVLADSKIYWLKVYRAGYHTQGEIQAEVNLLLHLRRSGVRACVPMARIDGGYVCEFETVTGPRCGVLYETAGIHAFNSTKETPEKNARLGEYIAQVHHALDSMPPINRTRLDCASFIDDSMPYIREFAKVHAFDLPFVEDIAARTKSALADLDEEKPAFGLCHGDIYEGNLRLDGEGNPVLFDFDFAGYGWRAYDVSMYACNFSLGADPAELEARARRFEAFMEGYSRVRPMPESELRTIPWFIPFRRIFNLGTLYLALLSDTWGDLAQIRNVEDDIAMLKRWVELNL